MEKSPTRPKHNPYQALQIPNYRNFTLGYLLYSIGLQMMDVAVGWELYERTGSAAALGFSGLVQVLPVIALTLHAGHASDRYDRRHILIATLLLKMLSALGLAFLSHKGGSLLSFYLFLFLGGVARAFHSPARSALLPALVPTKALSNAVSWNSNLFQVATTAGPMVGGFVIAITKNYSLVYVICAFTCAVFAALLAVMKVEPRKMPATKHPLNWTTLMEGAHFVYGNKLILSTLTLDLFAVLLGGAVALLPVFAKDILHTNAVGLGWLRAAPAVGAFVMGFLLTHLPPRLSPLRYAGKSLLWSVAGFGLATIVFGLSRNFWLSVAMLFLTGALDNISVVIRMTLIQMLTPDQMRGRVSAVNYLFIGSSNELGAFESGMAAAAFGPIVAVVGGGVGTILVVLAVAWAWPQVRTLQSLDDAAAAGS